MQKIPAALLAVAVAASAPLFPLDHANITSMTNASFYTLLEGPEPWIIDFYHPYCTHCVEYAAEVATVAAHFALQKAVRVGVVSCLDAKELCAAQHIAAFPALGYYNFRLMRGVNYVDAGAPPLADVAQTVQMLQKGVHPADPSVDHRPLELHHQSSAPLTRYHDGIAAFLFGLHHHVFHERETLRPAMMTALCDWIYLVGDAMPHDTHRRIVLRLHAALRSKTTLEVDAWRQLLARWAASTDDPLFHGDGTTYMACTSYNCGLWTLLHRMSLSPAATRVVPALQLYMAFFGHCVPCRVALERFHTIERLDALTRAPPSVIALHMWRLHNAINSATHAAWPSHDHCPHCRSTTDWDEAAVLSHLQATFATAETLPLGDASVMAPPSRLPWLGLGAASGAAIAGLVYVKCRRSNPSNTKLS
ncbi:hypothetical protein SPRG_01635 [Saprolegnia parasitica CBS 223.65]|uniref:Sulfhydryl oxidase n=1 Tax=Saprolegnia parasitica (strain CBS 223.65) TaxID=695850 RepID=A0A067CSU6_SAPPC|nr:hypothetical protein SPRG_01635 [Saprolegnia parasitica CBS 223.65]KDO33754.1 hypothetical protein SPRG_01635 [Saprolegnia parasitica CBS 223.65]|eukprot:XP_012195392.1 hypothetical protein SPRG_01635 [Saprolegnia parasitica CBS 223.65]